MIRHMLVCLFAFDRTYEYAVCLFLTNTVIRSLHLLLSTLVSINVR